MELSLPSFLFLILIIFPSLIQLHKPIQAADVKYQKCKNSFKCGNLENIGYPFYDGVNHPEYCGYPGFKLDCSDDKPEIAMSLSEKYYLINYTNSTSNTISVARKDDWEDYCSKERLNTSINISLFGYTFTDVNVTLYYDQCSSDITTEGAYPFSCGDANGYFMINYAGPGSAMSRGGPLGGCQRNAFVPVNRTVAVSVTDNDSLQEAFQSEFELEWFAENQLCKECVGSGGVCGSDPNNLNKFTCYCADQPHDYTCNGDNAVTPTNQKSGKSTHRTVLIIGLVVGGVSLLALIVFSSLFIQRRRRRLLSQAQSKDLGLGPLSSGLSSRNGYHYSQDFTTSPSTNLSQSIPSYPSSKSDFDNASFYYGVKVFSYAELEEATDNFNESRELGDGGFGTVYYGKLRDGRLVAVKRLYESSCKRMGQFMNEIEILARLRHKYLVTLHGCTSKRSKELLLVYEYISNGTVADHIHAKLSKSSGNNNTLPWSTRLSIAVQTAEALTFLHKSDVVHRDVKTTNILLDHDFQVKVADFGLSRLFPNDVTHVSTAPQGTPGYVDPEYYKCYQLTEKSDVYSFGVVLVELISSKPAVDITRHRHDINLSNMAIDRVRKNAVHELVDPDLGYERDYVVQKMVKLVAELAFQCLQEEREMRPCMEEVLKSLRAIQKEIMNSQNQVVMDIQEIDDDVSLLKNVPPPLSPETNEVNDKRVR